MSNFIKDTKKDPVNAGSLYLAGGPERAEKDGRL